MSAPPPAGRRRSVVVGDLPLESGHTLPGVRMAFETWGTLNKARDNAVLVEHALTGDSHVVGEAGADQPTAGWWPELIGPGQPLDTDRFFVIAANVLGGCRGSTGPSSPAPDGRPYGSSFPYLTIRDQVSAEALLADRLTIASFAAVIGGSMGGMRALEWAASHPERIQRCIAIATNAVATADQIAWSTPQLFAIRNDPGWMNGDYYPGPGPRTGLATARQIAHATYRAAPELNPRFENEHQVGEDPATGGRFAVQSYLEHHGTKLVRRFDAGSYVNLTEAMNSNDLGRGRGGLTAALERITADLTVAAVDSDRLFPVHDSELIAAAPTCREFSTISSPFGHDAFLIETPQVFAVIERAMAAAPGSASARVGRRGAPVRSHRLSGTGLW